MTEYEKRILRELDDARLAAVKTSRLRVRPAKTKRGTYVTHELRAATERFLAELKAREQWTK